MFLRQASCRLFYNCLGSFKFISKSVAFVGGCICCPYSRFLFVGDCIHSDSSEGKFCACNWRSLFKYLNFCPPSGVHFRLCFVLHAQYLQLIRVLLKCRMTRMFCPLGTIQQAMFRTSTGCHSIHDPSTGPHCKAFFDNGACTGLEWQVVIVQAVKHVMKKLS